jgi:hypothetical protein
MACLAYRFGNITRHVFDTVSGGIDRKHLHRIVELPQQYSFNDIIKGSSLGSASR